MELLIGCDDITNDDLITGLERLPGWVSAGVRLELRRGETTFRGLPPTVVVALVSGTATVLSGLITYLITLANQSGKREIFLKVSHDSLEVRVPADADPAAISRAVETLRKIEPPLFKV